MSTLYIGAACFGIYRGLDYFTDDHENIKKVIEKGLKPNDGCEFDTKYGNCLLLNASKIKKIKYLYSKTQNDKPPMEISFTNTQEYLLITDLSLKSEGLAYFVFWDIVKRDDSVGFGYVEKRDFIFFGLMGDCNLYVKIKGDTLYLTNDERFK
jgi:hypothetical protein